MSLFCLRMSLSGNTLPEPKICCQFFNRCNPDCFPLFIETLLQIREPQKKDKILYLYYWESQNIFSELANLQAARQQFFGYYWQITSLSQLCFVVRKEISESLKGLTPTEK